MQCTTAGKIAAAALLAWLASAVPAGAADTPFAAEGTRLSIFAGSASAFDRQYTLLGFGVGYFVADGVEAGLDAEFWTGNSPAIEQVSPQIRYIMRTGGSVNPYVGAFFRETFIRNYGNRETVGSRAGIYVQQGDRFYFGVGLAGEVHVRCDRTVYSSCVEAYPEILFAVVF